MFFDKLKEKRDFELKISSFKCRVRELKDTLLRFSKDHCESVLFINFKLLHDQCNDLEKFSTMQFIHTASYGYFSSVPEQAYRGPSIRRGNGL